MQQGGTHFRYMGPESCLSRSQADSQEDRDTQDGAVARRGGWEYETEVTSGSKVQ